MFRRGRPERRIRSPHAASYRPIVLQTNGISINATLGGDRRSQFASGLDQYSGKGVEVGVYDLAVQWAHHDLDDNYDASLQLESDGTVFSTAESHGTNVAGTIAAERNGTGTVAYDASITGVKAFNDSGGPRPYELLVEAMALQDRFDVVNHSWGFTQAFAYSLLDFFSSEFHAGIENVAQHGRDDLGTLIVVAAGNEREMIHDTNHSGFTANRYVITVGAVD